MILQENLFTRVSPKDLEIIGRYGVVKTYPKLSMVIHEGDQSDSFFIILRGQVKIYVSDGAGKEVLLTTQGPGEFFGELSLIDEAPRSASVMTLQQSCLNIVTRTGFLDCLSEHPEIALKLIFCLCHRVRTLTERVKELALLGVCGRISQLFNELAVERTDKRVIEQRLTHRDIAERVCASREMVSRILKDLIMEEYIEIHDKQIIIKKNLP